MYISREHLFQGNENKLGASKETHCIAGYILSFPLKYRTIKVHFRFSIIIFCTLQYINVVIYVHVYLQLDIHFTEKILPCHFYSISVYYSLRGFRDFTKDVSCQRTTSFTQLQDQLVNTVYVQCVSLDFPQFRYVIMK